MPLVVQKIRRIVSKHTSNGRLTPTMLTHLFPHRLSLSVISWCDRLSASLAAGSDQSHHRGLYHLIIINGQWQRRCRRRNYRRRPHYCANPTHGTGRIEKEKIYYMMLFREREREKRRRRLHKRTWRKRDIMCLLVTSTAQEFYFFLIPQFRGLCGWSVVRSFVYMFANRLVVFILYVGVNTPRRVSSFSTYG